MITVTMNGLIIFVYMMIALVMSYSFYVFMEDAIKSGGCKNVAITLIALGAFWPLTLLFILICKFLKS